MTSRPRRSGRICQQGALATEENVADHAEEQEPQSHKRRARRSDADDDQENKSAKKRGSRTKSTMIGKLSRLQHMPLEVLFEVLVTSGYAVRQISPLNTLC
jgi:biotin carboxyl carrier protein